jgi:predicted nucleic acid-binding protein
VLVIDASVVLALLTGHPASHKIARTLRADPDVIAPAHLDAEVCSALRGRMLGGHLTEDEVRTATQHLAALPVRRMPLDDIAVLHEALTWFHNLSAYDALYLALATLTGAVLVTGDAGLAGVAARAKVPHRQVDCSA